MIFTFAECLSLRIEDIRLLQFIYGVCPSVTVVVPIPLTYVVFREHRADIDNLITIKHQSSVV